MTEVSLHGATKLTIAKTYHLTGGTQVVRLKIDNADGPALEITLYVVEGKQLNVAFGEDE